MSTTVDTGNEEIRRAPAWGRWHWIALGAAVVAVALDQVTKAWAQANLSADTRRPLIGDVLTLQLTHNPGAAFSFGEHTTWLFAILSVVVIALIAVVLPRLSNPVMLVALGLLAGGAVGNLIDRLIQPPSFGQGHVVDFINYNGWFIGNVADIWIVGAAILLVVSQLVRRPEPATDQGPDKSIDEGDPGEARSLADSASAEAPNLDVPDAPETPGPDVPDAPVTPDAENPR